MYEHLHGRPIARLSAADEAAMLKADEDVAEAEKWAAAFETLPICVSKYS